MRRKSERNKAKPAEKKPEPAPKKSRRSSRRRKRSTSRSSSEDSDDAPLKIAPEIVEPVATPVEEPKKSSSHSNSDEDKDEQPIWKVKTSDVSSGEIQKLKICLQRPSTTPERTEKSPRRRRGKTSSQSDEASLTPDEKIHKRKTRNSPSVNTSEGSSLDNSAIEAAEKDENLIIIKETNEIIIGKGKLDSSQTQQDSENEKYVQDSQIEENEKESQNELVKKDDIVESKNDQDHLEENTVAKQDISDESTNKQTETDEVQYSNENKVDDKETIKNNETELIQSKEKVNEVNTPKEKDSKNIESDSDNTNKKIKPEDSVKNESQILEVENNEKEENKCFEIDSTVLNYSAVSEEANTSVEIQNSTVEEDKTICSVEDKTNEEKKNISENNETSVEKMEETSVEKMETSKESDSLMETSEKPSSPKEEEKPVNKSEESPEIVQDKVIEKLEDKKIDESSTKLNEPNEKLETTNEEVKMAEEQLPTKVEEATESSETSEKKLGVPNKVQESAKIEDLKEKSQKPVEKLDDDTVKESAGSLEDSKKKPQKPVEKLDDDTVKKLDDDTVKKSAGILEDSKEKPQKPVEKQDDDTVKKSVGTLEDSKENPQKQVEKQDNDTVKESKEVPQDVVERKKSDDIDLNISESTKKMNKNTDTIQIEESSSDRIVRKRKWGKYKVNLCKEERITLNSIASFCPLVKMLNIEELKLERQDAKDYEPKLPKRDRHKDKDTVQMPSLPKNEDDSEKEVSNIGLNRKISIVNDEASKLQPPPSPANNPVSAILYITNLVRPFTLKQLQELLSRTGKIIEDGFWTDKIKSKCYVEYETEEEAENTRNALHGVQWPTGNGKKLVIDFATAESMKAARNVNIEVPVVVKTTPDEIPEKVAETAKKEIVSNEQRWDNQRTTAPIREWDLGKVPQDFRDRSRSKDRMDNRSDRAEKRRPSRNDSPPNGDQLTSRKKRKEEQTEVKLMDDLFHKTKATPSIYWLPLSPEQIAKKQQQRLQRMAEHKRRMEESRRFDRDRDFGRGGGQRARRRSARYDGD